MDLSGLGAIPQGEGIAYGRVKVVWKGDEQTSLSSVFVGKPWRVVILPDGSSNGIDDALSGDGSFFWHLPSGGYTIAGVHGLTPFPASAGIDVRIFTHFNVLGNAASYVGTLVLSLDGGRYRLSIEDDYEIATKGLSSKFSEIETTTSLRKELMVLEPRR